MAYMDEYVCRCEGAEREVAGAVTGIPADDHIEPCILQGARVVSSPSFQAGRQLENNAFCPALPQRANKIRDIV
jgi:hypothetical protein